MKQTNNYCVIMAGGIGSRFWPLSTSTKPKQFLDILGTGESLIQQTYHRFKTLVPDKNFYVVTNEEYKNLVKEQLPNIPSAQILTEPFRRNTAPCIAYASFKIASSNQDAKIIVTPADHLITKEQEFNHIIENSLDYIEETNVLLTLGIKPTRPETGYGYIQVNDQPDNNNFQDIKKAKTFTEKPNKEIAQMFFESGDFYWNSGIFIWKLSAIMEAFQEYLPDLFYLFEEKKSAFTSSTKEQESIETIYAHCDNVSIDYGIMEKARNVMVYKSDIGWSDLGTWGSVYDHLPLDTGNNALLGDDTHVFETHNSIIHTPKKKKAIIAGLEGYIVIDSEDALLICKKEDEQHIKHYLDVSTSSQSD